MSNVIKFSIDGDTNVEQVTNRAKTAVSGFDKQVEGIGKKFGSAFKDIFLGFAAPMVILNNAISMIGSAMEKAKQDARDGLDLLAKGETMYATSEEKKMAAFFKAKRAREEEMATVSTGKSQIAAQFLGTEQGKKIAYKLAQERGQIIQDELDLLMFPKDPEFQKRALDAFLKSPEGKTYQPIFDSAGKDTFKPEGLSSNVVGVGQSPGMAALNEQVRLQQEIAEMMRRIAEKYDAKESVNRAESTPFKLKPEYSTPAYPQFK